MHEHYSARVDSVVNETTCVGKVDEEVGVVDVLNVNAKMADTGRGIVGRDRFRSYGDDMRYASVCKGPGRNGSVDAAGGECDRENVPLEKPCQRMQCHGRLTCPKRACPR